MTARLVAGYAAARSVPALVGFLSIVLYSRSLDAAEYGRYVVAVASSLLVSTLAFEWLRLSTMRLLPEYQARGESFLPVARGLFAVAAAVALSVGIAVTLALGTSLPALVATLAVLSAFVDLSAEVARASFDPLGYGLILTSRSVLGLSIGLALVLMGAGGTGAILGLAFGALLTSIAALRVQWWRVRVLASLRDEGLHALTFGAPVAVGLVLYYTVSVSDRLIVERIAGVASAGVYAVASDLPRQSLGTLLMVLSLGGLPLAIRRYHEAGIAGMQSQLAQNGELVLAVGLPAAAGLASMSGSIGEVVVGSHFSKAVADLVPPLSVAVFLQGVKTFYVDHVFVVSKRVRLGLVASLASAAVSVTLNVVLVGRYGIEGAVVAALCAAAVGLIVSVVLAQRICRLVISRNGWKVLISSVVMYAALRQLPRAGNAPELASYVGAGASLYVLSMLALDAFSSRSVLLAKLRRGMSR